MSNITIFGSGQIGQACAILIKKLFTDCDIRVEIWDQHLSNIDLNCKLVQVDLQSISQDQIKQCLEETETDIVINALPFFLNEKIAAAARAAQCHYVDFTEDDLAAEAVQNIYRDSKLVCAAKSGLAPGFVNYLGHDLVKKISQPEKLLISVGALSRNVNYSDPKNSYNLTWSVDGLVNEYIRPCQVRLDGQEQEISPLAGLETVIADGITYEAAFTSGGIGSLIRDLNSVPNVMYKTLRYPGHYGYVKNIVDQHQGNFDLIKKEFLETFPHTRDDVVVVYAEAVGRNQGRLVRESYSGRFFGIDNLTAIQTTTAGGGLAVVELIIQSKISNIITHSSLSLDLFNSTRAAEICYKITKKG
jgi:saccharopine dehydrogenase-like NADP-dependent oxidoreductase